MKKIFLMLAMLFCFSFQASAQQIINGSQSFVPGAWVGAQVPNASSTGTTVNKIAKLTGAGTAVISTTSDTTGFLGIVALGAGTTGNASIVTFGEIGCVFDGATTQNDFVINSVTVNGDCHDAGSTPPVGPSIGRVMSTNGSGGTYTIFVVPNSSGSGIVTISTTAPLGGGASTSTVTLTCSTCTVTVASGTSTLGTSAINSGSCASVVTTTATGTVSTDVIDTTANADLSAVTGYSGVGTVLTIYVYPTSGNVNYHVCNWTSGSITPTAVTLNWKVLR